jgi:antitoxin ParD1/3/4
MAMVKVTVTLPEEQLRAVRDVVASGKAASVSGFVQHAVALALDDVTAWHALLDDALEETGGALTDEERAWADGVLSSPPPETRSSAA